MDKAMVQLYLSRRNLLSLISKLDRQKKGEHTACTIVKYDTQNRRYPQTEPVIIVTAVEDADYYLDRAPGGVHPLDTPR